MAMQEALLEQKAQIKWFDEGDSNTRYFHNVIKDRRRRLQLHRIKNKGKWLHSDEKISNSAIRHFKRIFNLPEPAVDDNIFSCIPKIITDGDNVMLSKIPIEKEIKDAIFDMSSTSSAGPDGFNGTFYQKCWEIIKVDVINFVQSFFYGSGLTKFYSHSCLALIPKVNSPSNFSELRPISLSNFSNKIISKILARKLNPLLPKLISYNQSGFVKGRLITDNILLAQEIVHDIAKTNKGGNIVIKLDMAKAYDRLSWKLLIGVIKSFGFSEWWTMETDFPGLVFHHYQCLYEHPNFIPFTMSKRGPQINHLAYADDIVIFSAGKSKVIKLIMKKKIKYFDDLVSRITRKLSGWSGKCLSYGGKVTLIKSVLQAIPTYTLATLTPPKGTLQLIEKHLANFFWGSEGDKNKYHWRAWDKLCLNKGEGGIGVKLLQEIKDCFTCKRWWSLRTQSSLWVDFVLAKYCTRVHRVAKSINAPQSPNWKKMMKIRDKIEVKNYIEDGRWQADKLHDCIPSHLVQHILKIHIGNSNEEDYVVWESEADANFSTKTLGRWVKPDTNKVKLNTDGSFSSNGAGIGGILRSSERNMVMAFVVPVDCNSSSMAEAYAVKHDMQWCLQNGSNNIVLELDSLMIVEMLQHKCTNNLKFKGIIEEIMSTISRMDCSIEHCYREANQVTDGLAKYASKRVDNHIFTNWHQLPTAARSAYQLDKGQLPSIRIRYDKANFFVS
ncbi:uncharacterized protein LOC132637320 [Lycium barbarum]|uniref:uncharacterized protein LOC132637320 n=1 Tax=Lycium barbarum TaxID=112863 RepID=UPI00293EEB25|nr:uncharacterized protein LOC132637320 [Lycium barbarum]